MAAGGDKRATINDVAAEAGVSIKTVSRVVRREPNVSDATRQRVQRAVDRLGYRPTQSARSSVGSQSFLLGLLFDNPNPSYSSDLIRACLAQARADGFHMVVEPVEADAPDLSARVRKLVVQSNLAGLVLPPPLCDHEGVLRTMDRLGKPVARIAPSRTRGRGLSVGTDDVAAARAMTEHLIGLGHRRVGFVAGREGTATTTRRTEGYLSALSDAGIAHDPRLIRQGDYQYRAGMEAGEALLGAPKTIRPTAVFAANDDMAAGVVAAAYKLGLSVPDDVAVAGFDDSVIAQVVWPPLTTIRQPVGRMAAAAVDALVARVRKDSPRAEEARAAPAMIPCELVVRRSTSGAD